MLMRPIFPALSRTHRQYLVFASMIFASVICIGILMMRIVYTGSHAYSFLAWNLFLAWMPLIIAFIVYKFHQNVPWLFRFLTVIGMGIWLLFLPNAPYLITDLAHLVPRKDFFFWFDLMMFVAFAVTGLLYGLISLYWMQQLVSKMTGAAISWGFVFGVLALSSFGIYLGRFQRWNSWDVIRNPVGLLTDIWEHVRHPITHFQMFAFSGLFALFLIAAYFMLSSLIYVVRDP
jgi:uncharacterized membrane protein